MTRTTKENDNVNGENNNDENDNIDNDVYEIMVITTTITTTIITMMATTIKTRIPTTITTTTRENDYVVDKALDGIFYYVAQEEAAIRENPAKRTTELLKKVFGQ